MQLGSHRTSCSCWCLLGIHVSVSTSVCLSDIYISDVYQVLLCPYPQGYWPLLFLEVFLSSASGNLYSGFFSLKCFSHYVSSCFNHYFSTCGRQLPITVTYSCSHYCGHSSHHISMMWFCLYTWSWGTQWRVLLAWPLCHISNNPSPRCLFRNMPVMPWVLLG